MLARVLYFKMNVFYVYILQSQTNLSFYKGSTDDLIRRLSEHNAGKNISTKRYLPWTLVWFTSKPTKAEAVALEMKLKNLSVKRTLAFILKYPTPSGPFNVRPVQR
jgi:putative endonuclease